MNVTDIVFPLRYQKFIIRDKKSDDKFFSEFIQSNSNIFRKIIKKVLKK